MSNTAKELLIEDLMPKINNAIASAVDGALAQKLAVLKDTLSNDLWDKAVAMIGKQVGLPTEIIREMQNWDDLVKSNKDKFDGVINQLTEKVLNFQGLLEGVDRNRTITLNYDELQGKMAKASKWSLVVGYAIGFFSCGCICLGIFLKYLKP